MKQRTMALKLYAGHDLPMMDADRHEMEAACGLVNLGIARFVMYGRWKYLELQSAEKCLRYINHTAPDRDVDRPDGPGGARFGSW